MITNNITFNSSEACYNDTLNCHGYGNCALNGDHWICLCNLYYDYHTNCKTTILETSWDGGDKFFWISGLIETAFILALFLSEIIFQARDKKILLNEATLIRFIIVLYCSMRFVDYGIWAYQTLSAKSCRLCFEIGLFFMVYPYVIGVLIFKLCVVMWYNLVISLKTLDISSFERGRKIYIIIIICYATGGAILITLMTTRLDVFLAVVLLWIIIPIFPSLINCALQIYRVTKILHVLDTDRTKHVLRKNMVLGFLCVAFVVIGLLTGVMNIIQFQVRPDWWAWLAVYYLIRLNETVVLFLIFLFVEQYTSSKIRKAATTTTQTETNQKSSQVPNAEY
eukprot:TRINITY_DN16181_c0_g1_i3.p1 TRINITY_DN16181_c0_g1~~TRINITY_DN16181_c0_g1_i3.p1  ORF type:complete len:338 (-),score=57.76 TRINITY_DN16181_c0_g1_i3:36-1049(-)